MGCFAAILLSSSCTTDEIDLVYSTFRGGDEPEPEPEPTTVPVPIPTPVPPIGDEDKDRG